MHVLTAQGREFQIVGPATLNPREPKQVRTGGVTSTGRAQSSCRVV